jgi:(p)ppGpp synthase/HD superfamily hydrolase
MRIAKMICRKDAVVVAAFLHALLDDLPVPPNLVASRFGQSVADIMAALTRVSDTAQLLRCRLSFGVCSPLEG